ncbi:hypothetical protein DB30_05424 [Enhygromyxa salina]|uniref:Uncharacterized protein n=1 Tax=Enhygromyxa salina TaxID=215803 RepID=A0A0C2CXE8_9BACT|nr:hypothetical protein [Enhygromyxa salina]KIG15676.1 hypothetical protein DB30_05424 [Enhygromyxa salina]
MKTALIISELLELHDDTLIADIERAFDEVDRQVEPTPPGERFELLLLVDDLTDEMLAPAPAEQLSIELELELGDERVAQAEDRDEVAEVA